MATPLPRRRFLKRLGALTGAALACPRAGLAAPTTQGPGLAGQLPVRELGRTGAKLTLVGLGSAPVGLCRPGKAQGARIYRTALEAGVNWVDTAYIYDDAEDYLSELMPEWRERIFLVTKARPEQEDPREAARQMEEQFQTSLRRLQTDHVDLLHIHSVTDQDPAMIMAKDGPMDFVRKMKDKGLTRFIGVTAHNRPSRLKPILESGGIDAMMVALNFADYHQYPFERDILPLARDRGVGILAMKVFGGHRNNLPGYNQPGPAKLESTLLEQSLHYSLNIEGVIAAAVGVYAAAEIEQAVEWARRWQPMPESQRISLREEGRTLVADWGPRFGPTA